MKNDEITASVVVPCWNVSPWVDAALDSVIAAADRILPRTTEIICVDDSSTDVTPKRISARAALDPRIIVLSRPHGGLSAARNTALAKVRGKYIFFLDPDDVVEPDWLSAGIAEMDASNADWCVSPFNIREGEDAQFQLLPLKGDYRFESNDAIIAGYASRLIGYSFADLHRWFAGEALFAPRELGSVCRCVFRRDVIERHNVRFDETIMLWEDAFFNCEYLLHANRTTVVDRALYDYTIRQSGLTKRVSATPQRVENKFRMLRLRQRLNAISGGRLAPLYAASNVFAPLEMLATFRKSGIGIFGALKAVRKYMRDPEVMKSFRECPTSWRKPLFSAAVVLLRLLCLKSR